MANLRVIYDNAADRATLTASSSAGALLPANALTDIKSQVWRAAGTSATLTAIWPTAEIIAGVALPFCNLTSQASIRVRGYTLASDPSPVFDTGAILACPNAPFGLWGWGAAPLGANAYSYGGGNTGRCWITTPAAVRKIVIDLVDTLNPAGYVEVSRLVCGAYWQAAKNADYGASATVEDTTKNTRNDAGDLMSDLGTRSSKLTFSLSKMAEVDRNAAWSILRGNGMSRPMFISLFPDNADPVLEQNHQIYGKLLATAAMGLPSFNISSSSLDIGAI